MRFRSSLGEDQEVDGEEWFSSGDIDAVAKERRREKSVSFSCANSPPSFMAARSPDLSCALILLLNAC